MIQEQMQLSSDIIANTMNDALRETLQFLIGGGGLALGIAQLVRLWWFERSRIQFRVTGKARYDKVGQDRHVLQITVRVTNQSRLDNSISECWLTWKSQQARPPICSMRTDDIKTVTDGKRIFKVVFPDFEIEPSTIEFPLFIRAHDTVEGYAIFSTDAQDFKDISASPARLRIRDSHSKWYEAPVKV